MNGRPFPPIFSFGNPKGAVAATIGLNPSAREFSSNRNWNMTSDSNWRCIHYFEEPFGVPAHPWFNSWERFLNDLGLSYLKSDVVHFDLSPRATRSVSSLQKEGVAEYRLFLQLVKNDLKYLVDQLRVYPLIKFLYAAGSVTKQYYIVEFLQKHSSLHHLSFKPVKQFERSGPGAIGLYELDLGDNVSRSLFFCSTSPSSRKGKSLFLEKPAWLKTHYPSFVPSAHVNESHIKRVGKKLQ